jgi:hypothetical protein
VRPSALAVLRLMTSSNFVGCSAGRSAGFAPLRILSTEVAEFPEPLTESVETHRFRANELTDPPHPSRVLRPCGARQREQRSQASYDGAAVHRCLTVAGC